MTVQGLLGAIARADPFPGHSVKPTSPQPEIPVPNRGLTLLNKIFASASPSPDPSPIHHGHSQSTKNLSLFTNQSLATSSTHPSLQPSSPSRRSQHSTETTPLVFSQIPHHPSDSQSSHTFLLKQSPPSDSSSSLSDPPPHNGPALGGHSWSSRSSPVLQVLTQEVIFGLLGLSSDTKLLASYTHTRSSSTSTSSSRLSRYSGDAEDEGEGGHADSDAHSGFSHVSTVFHTAADAYEDSPVANPRAVQPSKEPQSRVPAPVRVNGDVTPRAPWRKSSFEGLDHVHDDDPGHIQGSGHPERMKSSTPLGEDFANPPSFSLHPFPVNPSTSTDTVRSAGITQSELQWTSTSANSSRVPSLPDVGAKSGLAANGELWPDSRGPIDDRALDDDADILELDFADTSALSNADAFMNMIQQKEKTRKVSASVAISPGGNSPSQPHQNRIQPGRPQAEITLTDGLVSSPLGSRTNVGQTASLGISVNGDTHKASFPSSSPVSPPSNCAKHDRPHGKHIPNGRVTVKGQGVQLDRNAVQQAIHTVTSPGRLPSIAERNEFVRELLTLVHVSAVSVVLQVQSHLDIPQTDKTFVDDLWRDYTSRVKQ